MAMIVLEIDRIFNLKLSIRYPKSKMNFTPLLWSFPPSSNSLLDYFNCRKIRLNSLFRIHIQKGKAVSRGANNKHSRQTA